MYNMIIAMKEYNFRPLFCSHPTTLTLPSNPHTKRQIEHAIPVGERGAEIAAWGTQIAGNLFCRDTDSCLEDRDSCNLILKDTDRCLVTEREKSSPKPAPNPFDIG